MIIGDDDKPLLHVCPSFPISLGFKLNGNSYSRHNFSTLALANS